MNHGFYEFNLLPVAFAHAAVRRRMCMLWAGLIGTALPMIGAGIVMVHVRVVHPSQMLDAKIQTAADEVAKLQSMQKAQDIPIPNEVVSVDRRRSLPRDWGELLRGLALMADGKVGFEMIDISSGVDHEILLLIDGIANSSQEVLRFASTLERSGLFGAMKSPSITFEDATGSVRFTMTAPIPGVAIVDGEGP